ncbi:MAG: hypothetical protein K2K87_10105 [Lachnospiraceae bacterium]|nr:hypothetical protein [Lachnospiraceae bacterium]
MFKLSHYLKRARTIGFLDTVKKIAGFEEIFTCAFHKHGDTCFQHLPYSHSYWYADPILVRSDHCNYVFMEIFDRKRQKGLIGYSTIEGEHMTSPRIILEEKWHLSFPMIFIHDHTFYMIPESSEISSLCLYRCARFPDHWELCAKFPTEDPLVDTIVWDQTEDNIRLLSCANPKDAPLTCKWMQYDLSCTDGKWELHPVSSYNAGTDFDYHSRNAGPLCIGTTPGIVIHPVQISTSSTYGKELYLYRYDKDGKDPKKEELLQKLSVQDYRIPSLKHHKLYGTHTYGINEQYEVIDIKLYSWQPLKWFYRITAGR